MILERIGVIVGSPDGSLGSESPALTFVEPTSTELADGSIHPSRLFRGIFSDRDIRECRFRAANADTTPTFSTV